MSIESRTIAWLLSVATAIVFGWLAHRRQRNRFAWALTGWGLGLVTATVILGLSESSFIPISPTGYFGLRVKGTILAIFLNACASAVLARTPTRTGD